MGTVDYQGNELVFGLDIGTRNVVGTVGYKDEDDFYVVAHCNLEHETRSMIDGQIHDIGRVGKTIGRVKEELESQVGAKLSEVCIAAAGRVLKTEEVHVDLEFPEERVIEKEDVHNLDLLGVEKAQKKLNEENDTKFKFYCVGYSVVRYYYNDDQFSNLVGHKATKISEDIIATFLPEDVVDGLYSAVGVADLKVANLTLEPIAAIGVAIPETYRLLNIALVDVGAGTSDISITRDGSIIAYGMIPHAGDELTEIIVQHYLVDFKTAEHIKLTSTTEEQVTFKDIMLMEHTVPSKEVWKLLSDTVDKIAKEVAKKIIELNGGKTVSACFVVGGGGKVHGFTEQLSKHLKVAKERVALRGEEVMQRVHYTDESIQKDPLLVTPIGICLNYYDQKNNFIYLRFNGERIKLYDNNKLTVMDAALTAGFPTDKLFPRRGTEINYFVNDKPRIARGDAGEAAIVRMNGKEVSLSTPIQANVEIEIIPSTEGDTAVFTIADIKEYTSEDIAFYVNGKTVICPKFVEVNGILEPPTYEIKEGDRIELRPYYTVEQLIKFLDVEVDTSEPIYVNNVEESLQALCYENFAINWTTYNGSTPLSEELKRVNEESGEVLNEDILPSFASEEPVEVKNPESTIKIYVNGDEVILSGRSEYMYADIFDAIHFNTNEARGRMVVTELNGRKAGYAETLHDGDRAEVYWKE
ncbi:MAG: rod shape-determining protein [Lachnospiraceae bacterium]|nr:rod shape-determining protein [Lachnospiraceae bacterium]